VSLHTIVQDSLAGRIHLRREAARRMAGAPAVRSLALPVRISIGSMRLLETALALGAIATALLIGHH